MYKLLRDEPVLCINLDVVAEIYCEHVFEQLIRYVHVQRRRYTYVMCVHTFFSHFAEHYRICVELFVVFILRFKHTV